MGLTPREETELLRLLEAEESATPLTFRQFVDIVRPGYVWYWHCQVFADVLERVAADELRRVMFFVPPRHGKSETITRLFPAYYIYRHPDRFAGVNCYAADLAFTFSRAARDHYGRIGGQIRGDAGAVKHWETAQGGGLWAAGVGGPITGKGAHLALIDDPIKNAEEAASPVIRAKQLDWYDSTLYTRLEPDAALVIVQTRWHEADLSGELLRREETEAEGWHVVNFEALKEAEPLKLPPSCSLEPDPRQTGEALCPERYDAETLAKIRARIGSYYFGALYQQRPREREGGMFSRSTFEIVEPPAVNPPSIRVRRWDLAASAGKGDYTVGLMMSFHGDTFWIEDVVRGQWSTAERDRVVRQTTELDRERCGTVYTLAPQDPGSAGKDTAYALKRLLTGFAVATETESGSKQLRAEPLASQAGIGRVKLYRGAWNAALIDEFEAFPFGAHDDIVDAASGAFNFLIRQQGRVAIY